ncbi:DnaJ family domain-containing protein [Aeribacillus alveayuensis]|uniref:DnaJ homologue subfamily C member 28 conserved domain-containing protein n=1 Tax=Aeribacillus alveayuensis TaxID=279215 RepID=A0ABT9VRA0_9BACI|nr:hypothetical protein [Bacillus alveayuensis]
MDFFTLLAEERIKKAYEEGEFKKLPGMGKPLKLDDFSHVPEELRMGYRMLKNANMLDEEVELKKEMMRIEDLIRTCYDQEEREKLKEEWTEKQLKLDRIFEKRKGLNTPASAFYKEKVYEKLLKRS